jgi:hypothetical protein
VEYSNAHLRFDPAWFGAYNSPDLASSADSSLKYCQALSHINTFNPYCDEFSQAYWKYRFCYHSEWYQILASYWPPEVGTCFTTLHAGMGTGMDS